VVQKILKEKEREMVFIDGWSSFIRDSLNAPAGFDEIPHTHLLLAIYKGPVFLSVLMVVSWNQHIWEVRFRVLSN